MRFTKMQGLGNDYLYVYGPPPTNVAELSVKLSERHFGAGADGMIFIEPADGGRADFRMRIFNADGSEAMMCGNASRCIGKYLFERGWTDKTAIKLETLSGIKTLLLHIENKEVTSVTVDMGEPVLENPEQYIAARCQGQGTFVSMGNPHFVVFTDDVDQVDTSGHVLEHHPAFPQRCNIEFARVEPDGRIRTRVWERGSGITQACGTGACATAVAAVLTGRAQRQSLIEMDGGTLSIEWRESDNHVYMTGPAAFVFDGEIDI